MSVRFHSGSRRDERPFSIVIDGKEHLIVKIVKQAITEDANTGNRKRTFEVVTEDGETYIVDLKSEI